MNHARLLSIFVFILCFGAGVYLSARKALWNDELYTQKYSIQNASYAQIITGHLPEGSNAPLFYLLQKLVMDSFHYHLNDAWLEGRIFDSRGQRVIRLLVNLMMSAMAAWMVYFFAGRYSWQAGLLCFLTVVTNQMFLYHWVEARPYALWFVLSALQFVFAVSVIAEKKAGDLRKLYWVHAALGLTIIFSFFQIVLLSAFLWIKGYRRCSQVFFLFVLPAAIGVYYRMKIGAYSAFPYTVVNPLGLVHEVFGLDRLLLVSAIGGGIFFFRKKYKVESGNIIKFLSSLGILLFVTAGLLLVYFYMQRQGTPGPNLNSRCLILLAPFEIITTVFFIITGYRYVCQHLSRHYRICFVGIVCLLYAARVLMLYQNLYADALYAY